MVLAQFKLRPLYERFPPRIKKRIARGLLDLGPSSASLVHGASLTSEVSLWFVVGLSCGVGATRDGPMRPATRGSSLTTKQQGALERSVMFSASRSKPRFFALLCGVSLVSPPCGSKPLLQLTAGTERACGSVWLVIRPQAKIRVRALSCVHITSQGPRPSLCRVHTVGVLGRWVVKFRVKRPRTSMKCPLCG